MYIPSAFRVDEPATLQAAKLPSYLATGAMPTSLVPLTLVLCVLSFLGAWVATRFLHGMPTQRFRLLLNAVLGLVALWLIGGSFLTAL